MIVYIITSIVLWVALGSVLILGLCRAAGKKTMRRAEPRLP